MNTSRFELIQGTLLQREGFNRQVKPKIISEETTNHNPYQTFYKLKKVYMMNMIINMELIIIIKLLIHYQYLKAYH